MAQVLQQFLIGLNFQVDDASRRKFEAATKSIGAEVAKLGLAVTVAAASIAAFVVKVSSGLDQLYFASQRTGVAVQTFEGLAYAMSQVGGSADTAKQAITGLSTFIATTPNARNIIGQLISQDVSGKSVDEVYKTIIGRMREMIATGEAQKIATVRQWAEILHMPSEYQALLVLTDKRVEEFAAKHALAAKTVGLDADQAAAKANRLMTSSRQLWDDLSVATEKLGADIGGSVAPALENLHKQFLANGPEIRAVLKSIGDEAAKAGGLITDAFKAAGSEVKDAIEWYKKLDDNSKDLIKACGVLAAGLLAVSVAVYAINTAMALNPFAAIAAGIVVVGVAIVEAIRHWKELEAAASAFAGWLKGQFDLLVVGLGDTWKIWADKTKALFSDLGDWMKRRFDEWGRWLGDFFKPVLDSINKIKTALGLAAPDAAAPGAPALDTGPQEGGYQFGAAGGDIGLPSAGGGNDVRAAAVIAEMEKRGYTHSQAVGVVANLQAESGLGREFQEKNPIAGRGGAGWAQWTGSRRVEFEKWSAAHGLNPRGDAANLGFLMEDLKKREYAGMLDQMKHQSGAEAAMTFQKGFERPKAIDPRRAHIGAWFDRMSAPPAGPRLTPSPAHVAAQGDRTVTNNMDHKVTINVNGAGDPSAVASQVARRQTEQANMLQRQMKASLL